MVPHAHPDAPPYSGPELRREEGPGPDTGGTTGAQRDAGAQVWEHLGVGGTMT